MRRNRLLLLVAALCLVPQKVGAGEAPALQGGRAKDALLAVADGDTADAAFSLRGFGTLAAARSSSDQADFVRDLSQPRGLSGGRWSGRTDSVLGLQASWQATPQVELVAQAVSRYRHDASYRPELIWGFVKWEPNAQLSLRGGRLGTEFLMRADSRLVGYSQLTVRPPPDYFGALPFTHIDGADASIVLPVGAGLLRAKLYAGVSTEKAPLADRLWDLDGSLMGGGHVDYQAGSWLFRLGHADWRHKHDLPPPAADVIAALRLTGAPAAVAAARALGVRDTTSHFTSAGAIHDDGPLQVQLMLSRTTHDSAIFQDSTAGYVLAGYRFARFTPYLGWSRVSSRPKSLATGLPDVPPLDRINAGVVAVLADSRSNQHTTTLGLRWDVRDNVAVKLQFDAIRGGADSIFPYRWEKAGWDGKTNVLSISTDFVF